MAAFDFLIFPFLLPFILLWILTAQILSLLAPLVIIPTYVLSKRLYWAVPIATHVWQGHGQLKGAALRIGFEVTYCINVVKRYLTLPLRRYTPSVYILGFPKCGSTTLMAHLLRHPAFTGIVGLPWHPVLNKESHFFNGVLGRYNASSPAAYRSFFPTVVTRWWRQAIRRAGAFVCVDACPITGCLPYAAKRIAAINPNAKLIFMVRDPVDALFSSEIFMRNLGIHLDWSFMEDVVNCDPRFAETLDDRLFWEQLDGLQPGDPLPPDMPQRVFYRCSSWLRFSNYAERVEPFMDVFPRENVMFVDLRELQNKPEETVTKVFEFVGVDPQKASAIPPKDVSKLPNATLHEYRGRRMHPAVRRKLQHHYAVPNQKLFGLIGRELQWGEGVAADEEEGGASMVAFPVIPVLNKISRSSGSGSGVNGMTASAAAELMPDALHKNHPLGRKDSKIFKRTVSISAKV